MTQPIIVIKRDVFGAEVWHYTGSLLQRKPNCTVLEAVFRRADFPFMGIVMQTGDRFVETYFTDRWYNIFEIHDRRDDRLKGWYCNIAKPAVLEAEDRLSYVDLALDLWVAPNGTQTVLDEDEFAALNLDAETRSRARAALKELQKWFAKGQPPAALKQGGLVVITGSEERGTRRRVPTPAGLDLQTPGSAQSLPRKSSTPRRPPQGR